MTNDYISRYDAVNAIYHHLTGWTMDECRMMLHEVPSAQLVGYVHIDDVYRLISGHSNYHGDNILAALTCLAEGKEVLKPIAVLETQPELYCAPQPDLLEDGTLMITVPHGMLEKVKRVLVDEVGTKNCKVMYQDEPERKNGHWIKISPANIYECSECSKNVMTDDISAYDFCHGCGAEMEGESNG